MIGKTVVILGAGLTGATAAWELARHGYRVRVYEQADVVGGQVRTEWLRGIPYEPHGAHIFHTVDSRIWRLVTGLVSFTPYRHRVAIRLDDITLSWPLQVSELSSLRMWDRIQQELNELPKTPDTSNFATYCASLLGRSLYEMCVQNYTRKQWGREPDRLSASMARKRVELRRDGYRYLFRDPYQGWPRRGYTSLVEALLDGSRVMLGHRITAPELAKVTALREPVIVTAALDDFFCGELGDLEWRGVRLSAELLPSVRLAQSAMVVNVPDASVPWTRTVETKWAAEELHGSLGTIVMREYPGAAARHYPVPDNQGANRARQRAYEQRAAINERNPLYIAGRLATYSYINMDQAIRQGLNAARRVLRGALAA